ncbi:hypothetical protein [Bartonella grahamii]|uniref:hypothetical protein n=1 Tax=Bartonella grahamii TaxID=33045 RepID=UPI002E7B1122|nr:hypothetical protein [Bartonella grahamii]
MLCMFLSGVECVQRTRGGYFKRAGLVGGCEGPCPGGGVEGVGRALIEPRGWFLGIG